MDSFLTGRIRGHASEEVEEYQVRQRGVAEEFCFEGRNLRADAAITSNVRVKGETSSFIHFCHGMSSRHSLLQLRRRI